MTILGVQTLCAQDFVKINQVGFYPDQQKIAVIEPSVKAKSFTLKDSKGKTVWSGKAVRKSTSPFSGKVRQIVDFSKVKTPGTYTLVAGKEKATVRIADNALADLATAGMKAYYLQRCGMPIEAKYAGKYARPAAHMDEDVLVHPAAASPERPAGTSISSPLGWYDAGDYGKYIVNSGYTIGVLLEAYELNKQYINKMQLNIPESGNNTPDFLDEIMYNLRWMLTMQDPYDGGVYHKLTTPSFEGFIMPTDCKQQRYVMQKSTQAALDFAATMAMAARIYKPYDSDFCKSALAAAERAYAWAVKNPAILYDQDGNNEHYDPKVSTGKYDDTAADDEFFWAATELYLSTEQTAYLEQAKQFMPEKYELPVWGSLAGLGVMEWLNQQILNTPYAQAMPVMNLKLMLQQYCDDQLQQLPTSSFNTTHGNRKADFIWASNAEMCLGQALTMAYAYRLTGEQKYLDAAIGNTDYVLGRNATGYCFVTGFGQKPVMHPHQRLSAADGIDAPLPGFLSGGPNAGRQDAANCHSYTSDAADESYTDDTASYASNEIAINWNAALVAVTTTLEAIVSGINE